MSYDKYSKATKETAENLRIMMLCSGWWQEEREFVRRYFVHYWINRN